MRTYVGRRGAADRKFAADPRNNIVFARVTPGLLGRPMATDRYHMRAYEARRRGALATDSCLKADLELIAQEWLADEWAVIPFKPSHFFGKEVTLTLKPRLSRGLLLPGANP